MESTDEVAVFLIGMRINDPLRVVRWAPVFTAMPRILRHLEQHPDAGLLGYHMWLARTPLVLTYWRSADHLQRFASDADAPHLQAWRSFQRRIGSGGAVGIWHETYLSAPGTREVIYANMPLFGLGKVLGTVPVAEGSRTAKQRLAAGR